MIRLPFKGPGFENPLPHGLGVEVEKLSLRDARSNLGKLVIVAILASVCEGLAVGDEERVVVFVGADPIIVNGTRLSEGSESLSVHGKGLRLVGYSVWCFISRGIRRLVLRPGNRVYPRSDAYV